MSEERFAKVYKRTVKLVEPLQSLDELLVTLRHDDERWGGQQQAWIFRGVSNDREHYSLVPSALRDGGFKDFKNLIVREDQVNGAEGTNALQMAAEAALVERFIKSADFHGCSVPRSHEIYEQSLLWEFLDALPQRWGADAINDHGDNYWPPRQWWNWVALAQHYGIPTRFLDWSRSPFVAAYFAASTAAAWQRKGKTEPTEYPYIDIWALNASVLRAIRGEYRSIPEVRVVAVSTAHNANLRAQKGVFTLYLPTVKELWPTRKVHRTSLDDGIASMVWQVLEFEKRAGHTESHRRIREMPPLMYRFSFPRSEVLLLLQHLDAMGVNAASIYPGFKGVVQGLMEHKTEPLPTRNAKPSEQESPEEKLAAILKPSPLDALSDT